MIIEKIAVKKTLAASLALGLSLPAGAWAQAVSGRVAPVSALGAGAAAVSAVNARLAPSAMAPTVSVAPALASDTPFYETSPGLERPLRGAPAAGPKAEIQSVGDLYYAPTAAPAADAKKEDDLGSADAEQFKRLVSYLEGFIIRGNGDSSQVRSEFQDGLGNWHVVEMGPLNGMLPIGMKSKNKTEVVRISIKDNKHSKGALGSIVIAKGTGKVISARQQVQRGPNSSFEAIPSKQVTSFLAAEIPFVTKGLTTDIGSLEPYSTVKAPSLPMIKVDVPFDGELPRFGTLPLPQDVPPSPAYLAGDYTTTSGPKTTTLSMKALLTKDGVRLEGEVKTQITRKDGSFSVEQAQFWLKQSQENPWRWEGLVTHESGHSEDANGEINGGGGSDRHDPFAVTFNAKGEATTESPAAAAFFQFTAQRKPDAAVPSYFHETSPGLER